MTFRLHRLYHVSCEKAFSFTVNVRSSIKTIILVSKSLEKRPWQSNPTPLEIASSWTPFPLEFLMPSMEGRINRILVWRVTVSIFSWTYAGIHVIAPALAASLSLNFSNSLLSLFSTGTKHEKHFNITSVNG